ncbi:hypothetical protein FXQ32_25570 [Salmonella enterica]|nr:hypothetical protein [Salmonella enterica]ECO7968966.1 hypothetical protein [Salmonella enterica]
MRRPPRQRRRHRPHTRLHRKTPDRAVPSGLTGRQPRPLRRPRRPAARSGLTGTRAAFPRHRHRSPRMTCRHWGLTRPARPAAEPVMN